MGLKIRNAGGCFPTAQPPPYPAPWRQSVDLLQQSTMRDLLGRQHKSTNPQSPFQKSTQILPTANAASPPELHERNKEIRHAANKEK